MRTRPDQKTPQHGSNLLSIQGVMISKCRIEVLEMGTAVSCKCAPVCLSSDIPDSKQKNESRRSLNCRDESLPANLVQCMDAARKKKEEASTLA